MRRFIIVLTAVTGILSTGLAHAVTSSEILARVKTAESGLKDFTVEMFIVDADENSVSGMGKGYDDILMMEKATIYFKKPDKMRFDGFAKNIKVTYIQYGHRKTVLAAMIKKTENVKNAPGKRQNSLDLGFLSSWLWRDNNVSVVSTEPSGVVQLKFVPKYGDKDKRCELVWIEPLTLKIVRRLKFRGSGELRVKNTYSDFTMLAGKLPMATVSKMYNGAGDFLGTVKYKNVNSNTGLKDSLFSPSNK